MTENEFQQYEIDETVKVNLATLETTNTVANYESSNQREILNVGNYSNLKCVAYKYMELYATIICKDLSTMLAKSKNVQEHCQPRKSLKHSFTGYNISRDNISLMKIFLLMKVQEITSQSKIQSLSHFLDYLITNDLSQNTRSNLRSRSQHPYLNSTYKKRNDE